MNTPLVKSGSVGMPTYTGHEAEPVDDPSPGVNSVLYDGTVGPTPSEDERREHWGLPPLPLMAQAQQATPAPAAPPSERGAAQPQPQPQPPSQPQAPPQPPPSVPRR